MLLLTGAGCCLRCEGKNDLRGNRTPSLDGGTTLNVLEADPSCKLALDGKTWPFPVGFAGPVKPGFHTVTCTNTGESIDVETLAGFDNTLDYWGP